VTKGKGKKGVQKGEGRRWALIEGLKEREEENDSRVFNGKKRKKRGGGGGQGGPSPVKERP